MVDTNPKDVGELTDGGTGSDGNHGQSDIHDGTDATHRPESGGQPSAETGTPSGQGRQGRTSGRQNVSNGGQPQRGPQHGGGTNLDSNVAAALSYLVVWLSGLAFLLIEQEDEFVRFHAAQSVVVFGGLSVLWFLFSTVFGSLLVTSGPVGLYQLLQALQLVGFVLWAVLMYLAYDGRWSRVPIAANIADSLLERQGRPVQQNQPR